MSFNTIYLAKDQGIPGGVAIPQISQAAFNELTDNNRKYTDQVLTDLTWNAKLGTANDSLLTAKVYLDFLNTRSDNRTGDISRHQQFDNNQKSLGFQVQHNWQIAENDNITYGFDYRNVSAENVTLNLADGTETENYDDSIGQGAVFAKYLVDVTPDVRLNLGFDPKILESSDPAEVDQELRFAGADSINLGLSYENPQGLYAGILMHSLGSYPTNNTNTESLPG